MLAGIAMNSEIMPSLNVRIAYIRNRCDHFTTLATLNPKVAATGLQLAPASTAPTTHCRRSR